MVELISFIQGQKRRMCLEMLATGPKTPGQITKKTGAHMSHISRALRELTEEGLAECITPQAQKNRFYKITQKGQGLLERLSEMDI